MKIRDQIEDYRAEAQELEQQLRLESLNPSDDPEVIENRDWTRRRINCLYDIINFIQVYEDK